MKPCPKRVNQLRAEFAKKVEDNKRSQDNISLNVKFWGTKAQNQTLNKYLSDPAIRIGSYTNKKVYIYHMTRKVYAYIDVCGKLTRIEEKEYVKDL